MEIWDRTWELLITARQVLRVEHFSFIAEV